MTNVQKGVTELTRQRVSEALFLIGFGAIWVFDLWWPGILIAFGVSWSVSLAFRKKYWATTVVATVLCILPTAYLVLPAWDALAPLLLVGVGVAGLARAFHYQG